MAPSGLVIPAAMAVRLARSALRKGIAAVRDRLPQAGRQTTLETTLEPALVRNAPKVPAGRLGHHKSQSAYRTYSTHAHNSVRHYSTARNAGGAQGVASRIGHAVGRVTTTSPFASTLRPKLCGGALPRSSGGYTLGGGSARYFSHTPAAQAQVIQQVSQAMRAFILSGKDKAYNQRKVGHAKYVKGQIRMQLAASSTDCLAPGAYVDFRLAPTLRCLSPSSQIGDASLDSSRGGFLEELQSDFSEVVSDISAVFQDLRRLSSLGDLPITMADANTLRVHFRGCDAELVNRLCDEVGVCRGVVHEDERFAFDKLAPSVASEVNWQEMMSSPSNSSASSFYFHEEGGFDTVSEDTMSVPPWVESGEEFYDEIDPGGESFGNSSSSSGGDSSFMITSHPIEGIMDVENLEAYRNPWATPARSVTAVSA